MATTNRRESCDYCGSSNNVCFWTDNYGKERSRCQTPNCEYNSNKNMSQNVTSFVTNTRYTSMINNNLITSGYFEGLEDRGISVDTCRAFNYQVLTLKGKKAHLENHYNKNGELCAQKVRLIPKEFYWQGNSNECVLGHAPFIIGAKEAIICEGAIDAMSLYEADIGEGTIKGDIFYLTGGAGSQTKSEIKRNYNILNKYEKLIFCFDSDDAGITALKDASRLFTPEKIYTIELRYHDPNEYLTLGTRDALLKDCLNYKQYVPSSIVLPTKAELLKKDTKGLSITFLPQLNGVIRGVKLGRIYTLLAGSGIGKSSFTRELGYELLNSNEDLKLGVAYLEEPVRLSGLGFIAIDNNLPLFELEEDPEVLKEKFDISYEKYIRSGRVQFIDASFMSLNGDELLYNLQCLVKLGGCKLLILDHMSMITYDMGGEQGERKDIDILMKNLRKLAHDMNVSIINVCHLKRPFRGQSWDEGREVHMTDARGSAAIEQLSDVIIALERNMTDDIEKTKTKVKVLKNRITGLTGYVDNLYYIENTGSLVTVDKLLK